MGTSALTKNTTGHENTALGYQAMLDNTTGDLCVAVGNNALANNTTGTANTAVGYTAMLTVTTATNNTAVGHQAMLSTTSGDTSTALGSDSLKANTTGLSNTTGGYQSMFTNTEGSENAAFGKWALYSQTTASHNTGFGFSALTSATTGLQNTSIGLRSLQGLTTGANNVGIGMMAGGSNVGNLTTGSNNTIVGFKGGQNITTNSSNTCIGNETNVAGHNHAIVLGYNVDSVGNNHFTFGKNDGADRVYNDFTNNATFTRVSDERYKTDIQDNTDCGLDFINELRTVTFKWKAKADIENTLPDYDAKKTESHNPNKLYGIIAQEVKSALEKHNITDFGGHSTIQDSDIQGVAQAMFVYPLIKAVQELSKQVTALQTEVKTLKGE